MLLLRTCVLANSCTMCWLCTNLLMHVCVALCDTAVNNRIVALQGMIFKNVLYLELGCEVNKLLPSQWGRKKKTTKDKKTSTPRS